MSYLLPHLHSAYAVDQAIVTVRYLFLPSFYIIHKIFDQNPLGRKQQVLNLLIPSSFFPLQEESRVVIIRFGHDWDQTCMQMDEVLSSTSDKMKNFAVTYLVDITEVPEFNAMYELYDPCTVMFFFRNKVSSSINDINRKIRNKTRRKSSPINLSFKAKKITLRTFLNCVPRTVPLQH